MHRRSIAANRYNFDHHSQYQPSEPSMKVFSKLYETSSKIEVGKPLKTTSSTDHRTSAYKNPIIPKLNVRTKGQKTSVLGNHVTEIIAQKANKRLYYKNKAMQGALMRESGV